VGSCFLSLSLVTGNLVFRVLGSSQIPAAPRRAFNVENPAGHSNRRNA
jgi:hypothetical protein